MLSTGLLVSFSTLCCTVWLDLRSRSNSWSFGPDIGSRCTALGCPWTRWRQWGVAWSIGYSNWSCWKSSFLRCIWPRTMLKLPSLKSKRYEKSIPTLLASWAGVEPPSKGMLVSLSSNACPLHEPRIGQKCDHGFSVIYLRSASGRLSATFSAQILEKIIKIIPI